MASVNKVFLVGNLGADPESRDVNDTTVTKFRIATSEQWTDKSGEKQERTEWHTVEVWGKPAEACAKYLSKGRQVCVQGSIRTDKVGDGDDAKYFTKIRADRVDFLGGKGEAASNTKPEVDDDVGF